MNRLAVSQHTTDFADLTLTLSFIAFGDFGGFLIELPTPDFRQNSGLLARLLEAADQPFHWLAFACFYEGHICVHLLSRAVRTLGLRKFEYTESGFESQP